LPNRNPAFTTGRKPCVSYETAALFFYGRAIQCNEIRLSYVFREDALRAKLEDIEADFEAFLDELVTILFETSVLENRRYAE
jgi:hypothetical protein